MFSGKYTDPKVRQSIHLAPGLWASLRGKGLSKTGQADLVLSPRYSGLAQEDQN